MTFSLTTERKRIRIMDTLFLIFIRKLPMINVLSRFIELKKPLRTMKMYLNNENHTKNLNQISNKAFWKQNSNNNNLSTNQNIYLKRRKKNKTSLRQRTFYQNNRKILNIIQQYVCDLNQTTIRSKIEAHNLVRDFQKKQQHDLESIHISLLGLKKSAAGNRIESDDLACDFQNRQQQDMELIKQSLLDLKQCVKSSKGKSNVLRSIVF